MALLYVLTSCQYGYMLVKYEKEAALLEKIRVWFFYVVGLMMRFYPATLWLLAGVRNDRTLS